MPHDSKLNLAAIRNRAYAATDGQVQVAYEIDCACEPWRCLAFVSADHDNAANNAKFLTHAYQDVLALIAEVERLRGSSFDKHTSDCFHDV